MGLTKQISGFVPENAQHYRNEENITHKQIIDKLGQLEDIEDKLGIDLITLFKALKNGCWYIHNDGHKYYEFCKKPSLVINWNNWCLRFDYEHNYELTKYKDKENGWALTKEELL